MDIQASCSSAEVRGLVEPEERSFLLKFVDIGLLFWEIHAKLFDIADVLNVQVVGEDQFQRTSQIQEAFPTQTNPSGDQCELFYL